MLLLAIMSITIDEKAILDISILPDGILYLTIGGDVSSYKSKDDLVEWINKAKTVISEIKNKDGDNARCITDVSLLSEFDEGSIEIMRDLADYKDSINIKTAVIGANLFSSMALKTIVFLTNRKNLKAFSSKEEALEWFKSS